MLDILEVLQDCPDLISQFIFGAIAVITILWTVAELTAHTTALLGADSGNPFLGQIHLMVLYTVDLLVKTQEVCFDIIFLAVVANGKKLQLILCINKILPV
jgi:hypothetical protein